MGQSSLCTWAVCGHRGLVCVSFTVLAVEDGYLTRAYMGLINPNVIKQFLARELDNHDWMKKLKKRELAVELAREFKTMSGMTQLWVHQLVCFLLVTSLDRFMLHVDMGGGKTLITLYSILYRKMRGEKPCAVVFVPYVTAVDTWIEECKKHTPELKLIPLIGTTIENERRLEEREGEIYVICYQSCVAMLAEPDKKKKGWNIDPKRTRKVFQGFDTFVADEIHKCSNISTLTYRMCRAISTLCAYGIGLSGTPFGKDVEDIWGQFYLIDFGETLGATKGLFQEAYFTKKKNYFSKFDEYKFDKAKMPLLNRMIKHNSIHYAASEMHDLPPKRYIPIHIPLPTAIQGYVSVAAQQFIAAVKGQDITGAEASYMQLRQLASGYMTVDGPKGTKVKVQFDNNPKLDLLEEKLDGILHQNSKMVVFHHFTFTSGIISQRLSALKIKHARIYGGQRDTLGELKRFREDPKCSVLVLNDQSGSNSLNLQHANFMFFFEQPDSPINRQQGERRIWRPGQTKPVQYIDPFMEGTVDEKIFFANQQGKKLLEAMLKGTEKRSV